MMMMMMMRMRQVTTDEGCAKRQNRIRKKVALEKEKKMSGMALHQL